MAVGDSVIEKFITKDGTVRAAAVIATPVIQKMQTIHNSYPVATAALGRAIIGAGLLASSMKKDGRLSFHFKGDGPLGQVFAEGDADGSVRGFVVNPQITLPSKNGKIDVGAGVGKGFLTVATSHPSEKQPYTGSVELQTGEIGDDIAYYLYQSQQVSSVVALGVFVEPDGKVSAAGGVIVQLLPGAAEKTIATLEHRVKKMRSITEIILSFKPDAIGPVHLAAEILEDFEFRKLDHPLVMNYSCHCSLTRVERALLLLGPVEIGALIEKNEPATVNCDFCGQRYSVSQDNLKLLLTASK